MIYQGIEMNKYKIAKKCPVCKNENNPEKETICNICGTELINKCTSPSCKTHRRLSGQSRYCPFCGKPTTFFKMKILKPYNRKETLEEALEKYQNTELPF